MAGKTLYLGPRLKKLRRDLGLTQANMASDLDISASYIALMERNQRPVTAEMLLKLATTYRIDVADLADANADETSARLQSALRDPLFADIDIAPLDVEDIATSYPGMAEALLRLHTAFGEEQLALAARREQSGTGNGESAADAVAEARAFLAARRNCFPSLDDSAAEQARRLDSFEAMRAHIAEAHGLDVQVADDGLMRGGTRWHDYHRRRIYVAERLPASGRRFQAALQLAILEQGDAIAAIAQQGRFASEDGRALVHRALQSYWAAALLMPYHAFRKGAEALRYDIEALAARFDVSFEQAAHRLTTLQRPGEEGVPFFFLRVDRAGNVSKRLDGAGFPLARHGGACPLWNIHEVFAKPFQVDAQMIEMPDGERYVSIARTVRAGGGGFGERRVLRSVALACSALHAGRLVYGDVLADVEPVPIGVSCRLCHRPRCIARSAPPMGRELVPARFRESGVPFDFSVN
ncbi:helix-turn-helix domain-containing protein [Aurantiacibacter gangjinensis]|uniref:XRE family transcriptional regulator n=1 Tax=Aurantiacibacter gangjinensis TaxID=502682 RepID=A0A0G9MQX9_9SPHN|nr:short-chain fatty acyl-CoA regulator family protein [Aurantiacibacter gangjinensis]APE29024.1 Transcriptional regulator, XRE family [Aurantiacibacter gangjinensis]KLE33126.1 XRE family transcriptional regulator [Aurantiacibacter gangjinensis]